MWFFLKMDEYFVDEKSAADKLLDLLVFLAVFLVTIFLILEILGLSGKTGIDVASVNNVIGSRMTLQLSKTTLSITEFTGIQTV